ncbi:MAG: hypothetical protein HFE90_08060 [Firmicutes bacterium]|nr:hypothetical protein [Bacillota bacterium]
MNKKIFAGIFGVSMAVLILSLVLVTGVLYDYFSIQNQKQLEYETKYIAAGIETFGRDYLEHVKYGSTADNRISWIAEDGRVIFDNVVNTEIIENHADREEIEAALKKGVGKSVRYSATLAEETVYYAVKLNDGTVLRLSMTRSTVLSLLIAVLQPVFMIFILAVIFSMFMARRISQRIVAPLRGLDFETSDVNEMYDELAPFVNKIKKQRDMIKKQTEQLEIRQYELDLAANSIKDGLIVINEKTDVLSYNTAAAKILNINESVLNRSIFNINRSRELRFAVDKALAGEKSDQDMVIDEYEYKMVVKPVFRRSSSQAEPPAGAVVTLSEKE